VADDYDPAWVPHLLDRVREIASLTRELALLEVAEIEARADTLLRSQSDTLGAKDNEVKVNTSAFRAEQVELKAQIRGHELGLETIRLFIELGLPYSPELIP
jgi:hypothetical protein